MPIYEFVCQSCGHEFEQILSFSDTSTPACGNCQSEKVVRRVGRPAIHFKGSGWYITDSRKSGANGSSEKASAGQSSDGPSGEKSSENNSSKKSEAASESVKAAAD